MKLEIPMATSLELMMTSAFIDELPKSGVDVTEAMRIMNADAIAYDAQKKHTSKRRKDNFKKEADRHKPKSWRSGLYLTKRGNVHSRKGSNYGRRPRHDKWTRFEEQEAIDSYYEGETLLDSIADIEEDTISEENPNVSAENASIISDETEVKSEPVFYHLIAVISYVEKYALDETIVDVGWFSSADQLEQAKIESFDKLCKLFGRGEYDKNYRISFKILEGGMNQQVLKVIHTAWYVE